MAPSPLASGIAGRCPNCGEGYLFEGFIKIAARCEACGFDLSSIDGGEGPAVFIILIVGALMGAGMVFTELAFAPPVWVHLLIWLPLTVVLCMALMRPLKGAMIASQYLNRARETGRHDL
jgi:uncharacterized protein (DUF983 family)